MSLLQFRNEFHDWCDHLSVDEIKQNAPLIRTMERMERILGAALALPDATYESEPIESRKPTLQRKGSLC